MTVAVKLFRSTDAGAPALNGTAGSMISLLDACLINGFNTQGPSGITRSGSVATATFAAAHGFGPYDVVLHAGADQAEYNGEFRIFNITANSYDFDVTGTPATPATGTLSAKRAPLNWTKAFSGTNKAAYKSSEAGASGLYLRIDDADARFCRTRGYETMSDVDNGTGLFPTAAQLANGPTWTKSGTADSTARPWVLVGDGRLFYLFSGYYTSSSQPYAPYVFGDITSYKTGDLYNAIIVGGTTDFLSYAGSEFGKTDKSSTIGCWISRSYTQLGEALNFSRYGSHSCSYMGGLQGEAYPSLASGGLLISPVMLYENSTTRGFLPGIFQPIHATPPAAGTVLSGVTGMGGRNVLMVSMGYTNSSGTAITPAVDITGPWR